MATHSTEKYCMYCGVPLCQPHSFPTPVCDDYYDAMAHSHPPYTRRRPDGTTYSLLDEPGKRSYWVPTVFDAPQPRVPALRPEGV